jgi:hypothetical protein
MSLFTAALDHASKQFGENGHAEYAPVSKTAALTCINIQEKIVQFQFQCVRCTNDGLNKLAHNLRDILRNLSQMEDKDISKKYLSIVYKIIGQTRDIESGKGERQLSYMMIHVWSEFHLALAKFATTCFVTLDDKLQYGSWKDMKRLSQYIYEKTNDNKHPIILHCIDLMNHQLRVDNEKTTDSELSLCSRWVPRESSTKGKWLFRVLAEAYFPEFIESAVKVTDKDRKSKSYEAAKKKTYMTFARMVSSLNKRIDTIQIKMCDKRWSEIDHHKTTSVTLTKSRSALMNKGKKRGESTETDRILCAEAFESYIQSRVTSGKEVKGKRVGIVDYVKQGIDLYRLSASQLEKDTINAQWNSFMSQVGDLGNIVAMVDQSGSMSGDPMHAAMGMGIAVAEKSALGKRVMTFSTEPAWVSLEGCNTFYSYIAELQKYTHLSGFGTNFFKALKMVLDACVSMSVPDEVVSNMTLAIFSDMQIDCTYNYPDDLDNTRVSFSERMLSMHERIKKLYVEAGYSGVPHILFWNLRHTGGFPTLSSMPNATMFSGFSPMLLNAFCEKGKEALQQQTPWDALIDSLSNERYSVLENEVFRLG